MSKRSNCWACIIYPGDSCPDNYVSIIQSWHIPALISPIHSPEKNSIEKAERKKHIHVMVNFGSGANKSEEQVKQYTDQLKGTVPFIVHSPFAMIRYFVHYDNPEKEQFGNDTIEKKSHLITFSGFDINPAFDSYDEDNEVFNALEDFIFKNNIYNFAILIRYLRDHNMTRELNFVRRRCTYVCNLLDGMWQIFKSKSDVDNDNNDN